MEKFVPKPGQTDFTNIRWTPAIVCILRHNNKILIIKRSQAHKIQPGYWSGVGGFLDDDKSLEGKVKEELREEVGIHEKDIISIRLGQVFDFNEPEEKKTWVIHPVLVDVNTDIITLDWEGEEYVWIAPEEIKNYKVLGSFQQILDSALAAQTI